MRGTIKFYRSYWEAALLLQDPVERCKYYDALFGYAFDGTEPDLSGTAGAMFVLSKPNIDAYLKRSEAGAKGGSSKREANVKQTASKPQANANDCRTEEEEEVEEEVEVEVKEEVKEEKRKAPKQAAFDQFWSAYPKKVGKEAARRAFLKTKVPTDTLIAAISAQKRSTQWTKENGRYIPNPATWLNQGRWEDVLDTPAQAVPADGWQVGAEELAAINAMKRRMAGREKA